MKRLLSLLIISILCITGCNSVKESEECNSASLDFPQQKSYVIPLEQQKEIYSVEDFEKLYDEYLKLNNITLESLSENDKTKMSEEDKLRYYTIQDITPKEVKVEIGCQIFKVNNSCESYVVYDSKVFHIGLGFGGFGIVSLEACDFDENGQKDLIYTFSWGSGLHRSHVGLFNLSEGKEKWLDFTQMNEDLMLEKMSENNFKLYSVEVSCENKLDYINLKLSSKEHVADVKKIDGRIEVKKCDN